MFFRHKGPVSSVGASGAKEPSGSEPCAPVYGAHMCHFRLPFSVSLFLALTCFFSLIVFLIWLIMIFLGAFVLGYIWAWCRKKPV